LVTSCVSTMYVPYTLVATNRTVEITKLTRGRPGAWETDLVHFIIDGNINYFH